MSDDEAAQDAVAYEADKDPTFNVVERGGERLTSDLLASLNRACLHAAVPDQAPEDTLLALSFAVLLAYTPLYAAICFSVPSLPSYVQHSQLPSCHSSTCLLALCCSLLLI